MARIDTLPHFLTDVADAIRTKKRTSETIQASNFDTEIENLPSGGGDITDYIDNTITFSNNYPSILTAIKKIPAISYSGSWIKSAFKGLTNITQIDLSNFNFSNASSMEELFQECKSLTSIDLSNANLSRITNMKNTFRTCTALQTIIFPENYTTSNVKNFTYAFAGCSNLDISLLTDALTGNPTEANYMFENCTNVTSIDIHNLDFSSMSGSANKIINLFAYCTSLTTLNVNWASMSNITNFNSLFMGCYALETLDLSMLAPTSLYNISNMFYQCTHLTHLDIRNMPLHLASAYSGMFEAVPANCEIIVKDDTEKAWMNSKFSRMTNVKTVAEYEAQ